MISALGIVTGFQQTIRDKIVGFTGHIQVSRFDLNTSYETTPVQVLDASGQLMLQPEDFPGVSQVQIYATKPGIISAGDEMEGVVLKGVGQDYNRSEEHTSELQSLMRISYDVCCLKKKQKQNTI